MRRTILTAAVAAVLMAGTVNAHDGATGVVAQRMDAMKAFGGAMKTLKAYVTGEKPFDAKGAAAAFDVIAKGSGHHLTMMFPKGSYQFPSEVLPAVWEDWARFEKMADAMGKAAEDGTKPGLSPNTAAAAFRNVAKTCKGCHEDFRRKKP